MSSSVTRPFLALPLISLMFMPSSLANFRAFGLALLGLLLFSEYKLEAVISFICFVL